MSLLRRLSLVLFIAASLFAAEKPSPAQLRAQSELCRAILQKSLVDFYLPAAIDRENGGYHEFLKDNKLVNGGEKFLTLQARQLWFFSTLAVEGIRRKESLAAAKHGFRFIQDKMRDRQHGGYFSKVTDTGEPKDTRKHAYLNAFTIYGLVLYHRASGDREALKTAQELFRMLEAKAHDGKFGGYVEFFEQDWTPVTDAKAQGYVGAIGHKTYNTHLHLLEAFAELYRSWPDPRVKQRLLETISINTSTVLYPEVNANVDAWERDWSIVNTPRNLRASYGHDVECVWLVMDAAKTAGLSKSIFLNWAEALAGNSLKFGYDQKHGGFYSGGPLGQPADDKKKIWWVETEALVGMLELYRLIGKQEYYDAFSKTLEFCAKYQVAKEGSWWATRAEDGSPTGDTQRSSPWQGAYHAGRAMVICAKWLDELASK